MADRVVTNVLRWETDKASLKQTQQAAKAVADGQRNVGDANQALASDSKALDAIFGRLSKQGQTLADTYTDVAKAQKAIADGSKDVKASSISGGDADIVGRSDTALSALGTLSSAFDSTASEALGLGADILASVDAFQMLRTSLVASQAAAATSASRFAMLNASMLATGAAIAGAAVFVGAMLVAIQDFTKGMAEQAELLNNTLEAQAQVTRDLAAGITTEDAQKRVKELERLITAEESNLARAEGAYGALNEGLEDNFGVLGGIIGAGVRIFDTREEELSKAVEDSRGTLGGLRAEYEALTQALEDGRVAASVATEAENALSEERERAAVKVIATLEEAAALEVERARVIRTATTEGVDEQITSLNEQLAAQKQLLAELEAANDGSEEFAAALEKAKTEQDRLTDSLNFYQGAATRAAAENEEAARKTEVAAERQKQQQESAAKAQEEFTKMLEDAQKEEAQRREREVNIRKKLADDLAKIERDAAFDRSEAALDYADELVDIARKAAEDSADALRDLEQKRADLLQDFQRGEQDAAIDARREQLDTQIEYQREEAKALRDHQRDLEKLREQNRIDELRALGERDFASLFFQRLEQSQQERELEQDFATGRDERRIALNEELSDQQRAYREQRADRLKAFNQQVQDAQIAYERERVVAAVNRQRAINEAQIGYQRELDALRRKIANEISERRRGAAQELAELASARRQRLEIERAANTAMLQQASATAGALQALVGQRLAAANALTTINNNQRMNVNISTRANAEDTGRVVRRTLSGIL